MAVSLKHKFQSAVSDGGDTSVVRPSNWNDEHDLTLAQGNVLGRATGAGTGAAQELPLSVGTDGTVAVSANTGTAALTVTQAGVGAAVDVKGKVFISGSTSGYVGIVASAAAGSTTYTLPSADGTSGQVLGTNGSGTLSWNNPANGSVATINFVIDGGGSVISSGSKGYLPIDFACTVDAWTIVGDQSGTITVDVKRSTYSGFPTTSSIAGTEKPSLSSAQKNQDTTLSSWTTSIAAGDILEFVVDASPTVASVTRVTVALKVTRA
jgi:hypothetical protein